jgi:CRISPR/Cas system Type II protein with McrA/HNH and RuvC-like nuclease domain
MRKKLSKAERQQIYQKCNGRCAYCGCKLEYKDMQADHMRPLYRGGADDISNMLPACRSCNHYKSTLDVEEFRNYLSEIPQRLINNNIPFQVGVRFSLVSYVSEKPVFYFEREKKRKNTVFEENIVSY